MNGGGYGWERARARPRQSLALKTILWWRPRNGGHDKKVSSEQPLNSEAAADLQQQDVAIVGKRWRLNQPNLNSNLRSPPSPLGPLYQTGNYMTSIAIADDNSSIAYIDDEPTSTNATSGSVGFNTFHLSPPTGPVTEV